MVTPLPNSNQQNVQFTPASSTQSEQQSDTVADILQQFEAETLSENDAITIVDSFREAGIKPSHALSVKMAELGFDAKAVGELAGVPEPDRQHKGKPPAEVNLKQVVTFLSDTLAKHSTEQLSNEQIQTQLNDFKHKLGISEEHSFLNIKV
ncbi:hypothetical protein [Pseudoalteromonas luteoviolacea]|uniref:hypothetical protein n=1 Tax=Pseudoalteromonas luteoviolacea TaxID=43657 RepID=UPI001B3896C5|nr:hypothetical protein [Pseudoalteromonas luteoviolacea]MBQ4836247.1 hypothetical protein [Pseudoalteromonas luteoviolacea]